MLKVENVDYWGFEHAVRGMRNPLNSWHRSDSKFFNHGEYLDIGEKDMELMRRLYNGGPEHRKYLRQIFISMDIIAPLYWWKEYDTYKIGTTANSCSTMHKIHDKEFTISDFSHEHLIDKEMNSVMNDPESVWIEMQDGYSMDVLKITVDALNTYRKLFLETGDKKYWWQLIQLLPASYNQRRTVTLNYENAVNIIKQRTNHKLDEWHKFVEVLKELPYMKEITEETKND